MKTLFILVLILINTNIFSQTLQNSGTNAILEAVFFIDQTTGWAVGSGGTIISTTNAGENWYSQKIEDVHGLSDVFFITKNLGWAVGRKGNYPNFTGVLLKTENGGETWEKSNYSSSSSLVNIQFINESIGWMTESSGNILKSYDSGATWQFQYSGNIDQGLCVINEQVIWVNGRGANMLKSTNGGEDWDNIAINNSHWWDIFFIDENLGWVAGDDGIKKTTDSGKN